MQKEKTKYPFHKNMFYLLKQVRRCGKEGNFNMTSIIALGILPKVLTPLAATFFIKGDD